MLFITLSPFARSVRIVSEEYPPGSGDPHGDDRILDDISLSVTVSERCGRAPLGDRGGGPAAEAGRPEEGEAMGVRSTGTRAPLAVLLAGAAWAVVSCSPAAETDPAAVELRRTAEALSVTVLRPGAERAFAREGHPLEGALECGTTPPADASPSREADAEAGGTTVVHCTGTTEEGAPVRFEGELSREALIARPAGDDGLPGTFVGTVDGEEVFRMDCLQCAPAAEDADGQKDTASARTED